jgi:DmsE family decaheme c-type cytochrome
MKKSGWVTLAAAGFFGAIASGAPQGAPPPSPPPAAAPTAAACVDCHEDQVKAIGRNPHSRLALAGPKRPAVAGDQICASCHGDTAVHMESSGSTPVERPMAGRVGSDFCLSCHDQSHDRASFARSIHQNSATVNCTSCHSVHSSVGAGEHLLARPQAALCATCHQTQASQFRNKPFSHRLETGVVSCVSCHDPHGRPAGRGIRLGRDGELPCLSCHAEKRGPFVFNHVLRGAGDCLSCHQPHGSSNPKMLTRARVDQLCLECHSPINGKTLGAQPPSFHNLLSPRYRNCTVCHVAVHGSNSSPALLK